jgi:hypothetical protein
MRSQKSRKEFVDDFWRLASNAAELATMKADAEQAERLARSGDDSLIRPVEYAADKSAGTEHLGRLRHARRMRKINARPFASGPY